MKQTPIEKKLNEVVCLLEAAKATADWAERRNLVAKAERLAKDEILNKIPLPPERFAKLLKSFWANLDSAIEMLTVIVDEEVKRQGI